MIVGLVVWIRVLDGHSLGEIYDRPALLWPDDFHVVEW